MELTLTIFALKTTIENKEKADFIARKPCVVIGELIMSEEKKLNGTVNRYIPLQRSLLHVQPL